MAHVFDSRTGEKIASYTLTAPGTFINDVVVTKDGAYFTDSGLASLFVLPLSPDGALPAASQALPLTGEWVQVAEEFNANGIEATRNGKSLIVVNSELGALFAVDPDNGEATAIDLGGASVTSGDGLLVRGRILYVVRNFLNMISVVKLAPDLASGAVVDELVDPDFRIPTTIASPEHRLYVVNARFDLQPPPPTRSTRSSAWTGTELPLDQFERPGPPGRAGSGPRRSVDVRDGRRRSRARRMPAAMTAPPTICRVPIVSPSVSRRRPHRETAAGWRTGGAVAPTRLMAVNQRTFPITYESRIV